MLEKGAALCLRAKREYNKAVLFVIASSLYNNNSFLTINEEIVAMFKWPWKKLSGYIIYVSVERLIHSNKRQKDNKVENSFSL